MIVLTLRTDKPEAEIGLYVGETQLAYEVWQAHRALAETIHIKIQEVLQRHGKQLADIGGIVVFAGPGSFTGLRIGLSVVNALAMSLDVSVVASQGEDWIEAGLAKLGSGKNDYPALPNYGSDAHITPQKK